MEVFHPLRNLHRAFFFNTNSKMKEVPVEFTQEAERIYVINRIGRVYNTNTNRFLGENINKDQITLCIKTKEILLRRHRILLATFDENVPEEMKAIANYCHVDHINGNHNDNDVGNLQYLTPGDHATKTMKTSLNRKSNAGACSKAVRIVDNANANEPKIPIDTVFASANMAGRKMNVRPGNISRSALQCSRLSVAGYKFEFVEQISQIERTEFQRIPHLPIDSKWRGHVDGRFISSNGVITRGSRVLNSKYTKVSTAGKSHYSHRLILSIKLGRALRDDELCLHDETGAEGTVLADGTYSNRTCDLRVGTHSENMCDMLTNKKRKRVVFC